MRGIRTTFVFAELIKKARELNYDFVFFDMGPSLGAINRAVLLAMEFCRPNVNRCIFTMGY